MPRPQDSSPSHAALALGALGVVYGDIATSPLYAFRESVSASAHDPARHALGAASLIVWSLVLLVSIKYLLLVLRADNKGEGGILALTSLAGGTGGRDSSRLALLGILGAALLYGDGILTPAVTVLSAMEGLPLAWAGSRSLIVPATVATLIALFAFQRHGTGRVAAVFGPVMLLWFLVLALLGAASLAKTPSVLTALRPGVAIEFLLGSGGQGWVILGSAFLAVTGAEALYADLGHFGARPIRIGWGTIVFPALILNYLGQAALVLRDPTAAENPFYRLAPPGSTIPLVLLATAAGVVASQALISGGFSLTMQAIQLGLLPRMEIQHTSAAHRGRVYITAVNLALASGCILLVLAFRSSASLAGAYGLAVSSTMVITTVLLAVVARHKWGWPRWQVGLVAGALLIIDLVYLAANALKLRDSAWLPLLLSAGVFLIMLTWRIGRQRLAARLFQAMVPVSDFIAQVENSTSITHVPGTAVFLSASADGTPVALMHNVRHNRVLHERVILLRFAVDPDSPHVAPHHRLAVERLSPHFWRVTALFGFMEDPDIEHVRGCSSLIGFKWDDMDITYFLGREVLVPASQPILPRWLAALFRTLARNAQQPAAFFKLPPNRVVELGVQVEM